MRLEPRSIGRFNVTHVSHDYRGELSHRVYSRNIPGDLVSVYDFADADDTYRVTHYGPEGTRVYHSLFPEHVLELGRPTDVILGGVSPRIDIRGANVFDERLLILSDRTVYAYISFLTLHFRDITILSTDMAADLFDPALIRDINPLEYDRILISLSIDSLPKPSAPPRLCPPCCPCSIQRRVSPSGIFALRKTDQTWLTERPALPCCFRQAEAHIGRFSLPGGGHLFLYKPRQRRQEAARLPSFSFDFFRIDEYN